MAKILGLKQLNQKKHDFLENLPEWAKDCFGDLVGNFIMIIWGMSGNGKSSFIMQLVKLLMMYGKVLYVGLEEGFEASMQMNVKRHLNEEEHSGLIEFADHTMTYDALIRKLKRKRSPRFIIIDSLQYWNITYDMYKALKEMFPRKSFIFISHAAGKIPDGKTADKIRYDAGIKVMVQGYIAHIISRYGGTKNYCIWEEGAKAYYDGPANLKRVINRLPALKRRKSVPSKKKEKKEDEVCES
ncbi:DNA repair protein RadA [compost metagenome]